ncbi:MAG: UPF0280 family protein [Candidatus Altiarchaeota archaeon]|nr:UPF0280 family protein [Candidatus Altiarchaeota archaeon]
MMKWQLDFGESHLKISSDLDAKKKSLEKLVELYNDLLSYINSNPLFKSSYEPVKVQNDAPAIVKSMGDAAVRTGVGPMAAVAGAISEYLGEYIVSLGALDVVVDNGGDIFIKTTTPKKIGIYAGPSVLSEKMVFLVNPEDTPLGVCTSSASVGHSVSMGCADSVTVTHKSAAHADAFATSIANNIHSVDDLKNFDTATLPSDIGVLAVKDDYILAFGKLPNLL